MKPFIRYLFENKSRPVPILSFPSAQLMGVSVRELIGSAENQARGMELISRRCNIGASLNMMDLSVEAEAFGAEICFRDNEIPTVTKGIIDDIADSCNIVVPEADSARCGIYVDGVKMALKRITDIPVLCGVIGPYSLAGRLFDMTELMMCCFDSEDEVNVLLEKTTEFIISYIKAFKLAGAHGVIMAEPAAGLLSPELCENFSNVYIKRIIDEISSDNFAVIYHNCGNTVPLASSLAKLGADAYHFGNAVEIADLIDFFDSDTPVMGNLNPVLFKDADVQSLRARTRSILEANAAHSNFFMSSGCDIPADSRWENIDAFFDETEKFYSESVN